MLVLPIAVKTSLPNELLEFVDQAHYSYTLRLPHYMLSTFIETSTNSVRATKVIQDPGREYNKVHRTASSLGWQLYVCSDYRTPSRGEWQWKLLTYYAYILRIWFGRAVYRTMFLVADYIDVGVFIRTQFMNCHFRSFARHVKCTKRLILLQESAQNAPKAKGLYSMKDEYSEPSIDKPTASRTIIPTSCVIMLPCLNTASYLSIHEFGSG